MQWECFLTANKWIKETLPCALLMKQFVTIFCPGTFAMVISYHRYTLKWASWNYKVTLKLLEPTWPQTSRVSLWSMPYTQRMNLRIHTFSTKNINFLILKMYIVRWPRSATSDICHPSSVIRHLSFVISFLVGAVMGVACLLASLMYFRAVKSYKYIPRDQMASWVELVEAS